MKVLLISPNHRNILSPDYMKKVQKGVGHLPPLGLLSIGTFLKRQGNYDVKILDALLEDLSQEETKEIIKKEKPDVVGISAVTLALLDVLETARWVKEVNPSIIVVVGGAHATIFPLETIAFPDVDYVIAGEGEEPLFHLLKLIESKRTQRLGKSGEEEEQEAEPPFTPIPGVFGKGIKSYDFIQDTPPPVPYIHQDLNKISYPDRTLTPYRRYSSVVSTHPPSTTIMGSRGCPFQCTFCHTAGGKTPRFRNVENIIKEIKEGISLGIREYFFFDETFTLDRKRVLEFCRFIKKENIRFYWDIRARVDLVDMEMLKEMKSAGCQRIQFGVESGSERILSILKKGFKKETAVQAFSMSRSAGIITYADFMIGNPGETREEIQETLGFARRLNPDFVHFSITMPLPHTPLYHEALERKIIKYDYWKEFARNPHKDFRVLYWEEHLKKEELEKIILDAYRQFYFTPGYMVNVLSRLTSPGDFMRKFNAGIHLFLKS